ncbi:MAG: IS21-like element helper ATPase IstB [Rhodopseudomonas palustris]|nr:IS21-like element helper ATPase IstB [Rhodopseudomonas palustris]
MAVDLDSTRNLLERLGLTHIGSQITELMEEGVREKRPIHEQLHHLLSFEVEHREESRVRTGLKLSGLPPGKTLSGFDFAFQPGIDRSRIELLSTCEYIRQKENVLFLGPPGIGKTHLAASLGIKAVSNGFSVAFMTLDEVIHAMKRDSETPPTRLKGKKYLKSSLLIIDEVGFTPLERKESNLFFRLISNRYERASIIITSNKAIGEWPEVFAGDETIATAILDRLLHHCHVLNIKGRSYRVKGMGKD